MTPSLNRSVLALLKPAPRALGWGRTRWSCATLAVELQGRRGIAVSAETLRHWLHELGWAWKRAKVAATEDDPERVTKIARIRLAFEQLRAGATLFFADELDINLLPKVGNPGKVGIFRDFSGFAVIEACRGRSPSSGESQERAR